MKTTERYLAASTALLLTGVSLAFPVSPGEVHGAALGPEGLAIESTIQGLKRDGYPAAAKRLERVTWAPLEEGNDVTNALLLVLDDSYVEIEYPRASVLPSPGDWSPGRGIYVGDSSYVNIGTNTFSVVYGPGSWHALGPLPEKEAEPGGGRATARQVVGKAVVARLPDLSEAFLPSGWLFSRDFSGLVSCQQGAGLGMPLAELRERRAVRYVSREGGIIGVWHSPDAEAVEKFRKAYKRSDAGPLPDPRAYGRLTAYIEVEAILAGSPLESIGVLRGDHLMSSSLGHWICPDDFEKHFRILRAIAGGYLRVRRNEKTELFLTLGSGSD